MGLEQHESVKIKAEFAFFFFLVNCPFNFFSWILHTELWISPKSNLLP